MNPYKDYIEPALVSLACSAKPIAKQRERVVPLAAGDVLEVGFGAGHNLPFYDHEQVARLIALEPSDAMRNRASKRVAASPLPVEFLGLSGEDIPLPDDHVDTVLVTYTLCTIPDADAALREMRRVVKPSGRIIFCEHGRAPDPGVRKWQDRLNGVWGALGGGCNLNRDIPGLLRGAGLNIDKMDACYLPKTPKIAGYNYWGVAGLA